MKSSRSPEREETSIAEATPSREEGQGEAPRQNIPKQYHFIKPEPVFDDRVDYTGLYKSFQDHIMTVPRSITDLELPNRPLFFPYIEGHAAFLTEDFQFLAFSDSQFTQIDLKSMKVLHHQKIPDSVKQERFKKVLGCSTDKSRILITSKSGKLLIYQPRRNLFAKITDYSYTSY